MKVPTKPKELWMLWVPENGDWAVAIDDPRKYDAYLCVKSKNAADVLRQHQEDNYEIEGISVRVI